MGYIRRVLNDDIVLMKLLQKDTASWSGRQVVFPVTTGRNWGVGSRADGGTLPAAQNQRYTKSTIPAKQMYGHIEVTGPTMVASRDDRGAFAKALSSEVEYMMNDLKVYGNIMSFGDGSGTLATVTDNSSTYPTSSAANINVDTTRYLRVNQQLDVIQSGVVATTLTVTAINSSTQFAATGTTGSVNKNNTDTLIMTGDLGNVIMGLRGLIDDGGVVATLQGITRSSNPVWKANVLANSGTARPLSLDLLQRGVDIALENGGGYINHILAHLGVRREYINLLTPDVRFEPLELKGGYKTLEFNGIPFQFDRHCQYKTIYLMNKEVMRFYVQQDFKWADEDGSILRAAAIGSSAKDSFEAFLRWMGNIGTEAPNRCTRIDDISQVIESTVLSS